MNGSKPDARKLIDSIMAEGRLQGSSHFSDRVYENEPILTTGRQMASYLPDRYREMKAISRWEPGAGTDRGRWLSEAELFYRQGMFMADFEDDCPHPCTFNSYFPTYNAMSDRQLRGYFSWRTAVRHGHVEESCLSFAYVYLYELICGIGVSDPLDGFEKLRAFWQAYRAFSPEIDRNMRVWLQDYVVYHGLAPHLLEPSKTLSFDRALVTLTRAEELVRARMVARASDRSRTRRKKGTSALPLPCDTASEQRLFDAIDTLSTYHLAGSRLAKSEPEALRHVCCAVFVRMSEHYLKQRKHGLAESLFGAQFELAYTMFGSAVFFDPRPHPDVEYELDEIHRYRCRGGSWSCERYQGNRSRNAKLGQAMRAADRLLREGLGFDHPLKEQGKLPKYLLGFIEEEVGAWIDWQAAHAPVHIEVDLTQLAGIRRAAADTRESLLIDEEREGTGALLDAADGNAAGLGAEGTGAVDAEGAGAAGVPAGGSAAASGSAAPLPVPPAVVTAVPVSPVPTSSEPPVAPVPVSPFPAPSTSAAPAPALSVPVSPSWPAAQTAGLEDAQAAYLRALLTCDRAAMSMAAEASSHSEDMLVDAINEALFDAVGDTVVEYGPNGPELIEDYREDVEGFLSHE